MKKSGQHQPAYKWGVALSGGGARGFAHLGALKAMDERHIKPEIIVGTSAGSLAGVLYADGHSPDDIYSFFKSVRMTEIVAGTIPKDGLFKSTGLQEILRKNLRAKTFEELKTPLRVIASDIETGHPRIFNKGPLVPAVVASCSIPIVFIPMEIEGHYYVDGGLFANFPVSYIRNDCEKTIGVNVSPVISMKYDKSLKYIIERTMDYMVGANTTEERRKCDYLIESDEISEYSLFDLKHGEEIFRKGYKTAVDYFTKEEIRLKNDLAGIHPPKKLHKRVYAFIRTLGSPRKSK